MSLVSTSNVGVSPFFPIKVLGSNLLEEFISNLKIIKFYSKELVSLLLFIKFKEFKYFI